MQVDTDGLKVKGKKNLLKVALFCRVEYLITNLFRFYCNELEQTGNSNNFQLFLEQAIII